MTRHTVRALGTVIAVIAVWASPVGLLTAVPLALLYWATSA